MVLPGIPHLAPLLHSINRASPRVVSSVMAQHAAWIAGGPSLLPAYPGRELLADLLLPQDKRLRLSVCAGNGGPSGKNGRNHGGEQPAGGGNYPRYTLLPLLLTLDSEMCTFRREALE